MADKVIDLDNIRQFAVGRRFRYLFMVFSLRQNYGIDDHVVLQVIVASDLLLDGPTFGLGTVMQPHIKFSLNKMWLNGGIGTGCLQKQHKKNYMVINRIAIIHHNRRKITRC